MLVGLAADTEGGAACVGVCMGGACESSCAIRVQLCSVVFSCVQCSKIQYILI